MSIVVKSLVATVLFAAAAAHAAPAEVVKLPRVVVTGKAVSTVASLPRVVVTGYAVREVAVLPRVVIEGFSEATLMRRTLAAKSGTAASRG